ncbi:MAG: hypothetical protein IJ526_08300 [Lachnospiraceae bacterium]|nr:hypothetical protein [Lachnospiraceae bacterium]
MDDKGKKEMSTEEMEKDFKDKMFNALAQNNPGVHMDQDGFIVMPVRVRRRKPAGSDDHTQG